MSEVACHVCHIKMLTVYNMRRRSLSCLWNHVGVRDARLLLPDAVPLVMVNRLRPMVLRVRDAQAIQRLHNPLAQFQPHGVRVNVLQLVLLEVEEDIWHARKIELWRAEQGVVLVVLRQHVRVMRTTLDGGKNRPSALVDLGVPPFAPFDRSPVFGSFRHDPIIQ